MGDKRESEMRVRLLNEDEGWDGGEGEIGEGSVHCVVGRRESERVRDEGARARNMTWIMGPGHNAQGAQGVTLCGMWGGPIVDIVAHSLKWSR